MLNAKIPKITLNIVIIRMTSIGDVILATSCLDALATLPVDARVTWVGREPSLSLIKMSYPKINCLKLSKSNWSRDILAQIQEPPHVIIDLQTSLRSRKLVDDMKKFWKNEKPVSIFMGKKQLERGRLLLEARLRGRTGPLPERAMQAGYFQYQLMLESLKSGLKNFLSEEDFDLLHDQPARPRLFLSEPKENPWVQELSFGDWLAVAPGAKHATKKAPLTLMHEILAEVRRTRTTPLNLVLLGDEEDRADALKLADMLHWPGSVLNLCGKLSLEQTMQALSQVRGILCSDSSLGHLAEALGRNAFVLFGPTVERFGFAPHLKGSYAFSTPLGCRPCSKHGKRPCRYGDRFCFTGISPVKVAKSIADLFSTSKNSQDEPELLTPIDSRIDGAYFRGRLIQQFGL